MPMRHLCAAAAALALSGPIASTAFADEIFLKNGDHVTGKIVSATGGSITFTPDFAKGSTLTISQGDIATFTTTAPLVVQMKNGTIVDKSVQQGPPGQVLIAEAGGPPTPIDDIDKINPAKVAWHGTVGVNGLYTHSTTTTEEIGLTFAGERREDKNRITVNLAYSYGRQTVDGVSTTNVNNGDGSAKYDFFFTPKWYGYANVDAAHDDVNFLNLRVTPGVGGGRQWLDRGDFHFNTEGGLSFLYEDYRDEPTKKEDLALRFAYHADKAWDAGRFSVFHDLELIPAVEGTRDYIVNVDAGLKVNLTKAMFSSLTGKWNYDNDPAPGSEKSTTEVRVGVGLTY